MICNSMRIFVKKKKTKKKKKEQTRQTPLSNVIGSYNKIKLTQLYPVGLAKSNGQNCRWNIFVSRVVDFVKMFDNLTSPLYVNLIGGDFSIDNIFDNYKNCVKRVMV